MDGFLSGARSVSARGSVYGLVGAGLGGVSPMSLYTYLPPSRGIHVNLLCSHSTYMCVCVYACAYVHVCVYINIHTYVRTCVRTYVRTYVRMYVCMYVFTHTWNDELYRYVYIYICVNIPIDTCTQICIYIYIERELLHSMHIYKTCLYVCI